MSELENGGDSNSPFSENNPPTAPIKPKYVTAKCVCKNSGWIVDFKDCPKCNPIL